MYLMLGARSRVVCPGLRVTNRDRARKSHIMCRSSADKGGGDGKAPEEGKSDVQDALADVMRLNIKKMEALDHLESVTNDEKLKIIQKADQALEEIDEMSKLNADRRKLAFGSAQADIDEKYRVMSEELKKAREEMEAGQADFEAFQDKVERDQQAGLWFKKLHARKKPKDEKKGSLPPSMRVAATARAVNKVREATLKSLRRRSRKAAFAFVIAVAGGTIASEIISGRSNAPVVKWHVLFLGMTALLAAWTSFAENDLHSLDFTQSRYGQSKSKNKDGS